MRAASSAWMVGGISREASPAPTIQRSPSLVSAPSCTSMRTSSPTKSGLPSLVASTFAATAAGRSAAPITLAARRMAAPASRPPSVTTSATRPPGVTNEERRSRSSGRAPTSTRSGTPAPHCTRCSTRSRSNGSAQCRSSITRTTGRAAARPARKRRTTKKVSSGDVAVSPSRPAMPPAMRARSPSSAAASAAATAARTASPSAPSSRPRNPRRTWASGAKVAPPAASQCAARIVAPSACRRAELVDQAGLPEAGRPEQHGEPRGRRRDRRVVHRLEPLELALAADERRRRRAGRRLERHQTIGRHRLGAALQRDAPERRQRHARRDQAPRRFAEHDVAVPALLLQPRRHVHRVADDVVAGAAHHHLAGVDGDAEPRHGEHGLHADQRPKRLLHRGGGPHGAERVVLRHPLQTEGRHHAVAEELHDRAAVRVDDRTQRLVVALHHAPRRLGVEPLVERRRADQVGEDDRHHLARAGVDRRAALLPFPAACGGRPGSGRTERRPALAAELLAGLVRRAARRTRERERPAAFDAELPAGPVLVTASSAAHDSSPGTGLGKRR